MTRKAFFLSGVFLLLLTAASAQDPVKVAPDAYKLEFENEWVKVTRVHYAAHAKIPEHDHTETGAAYIYLNDSGPVIFKHIGLSYGAITRPETKAGSYRLYKAVKETHAVKNPNETPSDFLRVEFKTTQDGTKPLRGKFYREAYPAGENFQKVEFENVQFARPGLSARRAKSAMYPEVRSLYSSLASRQRTLNHWVTVKHLALNRAKRSGARQDKRK